MFAAAVLSIGLATAWLPGAADSSCERCHLVLHLVPPDSHLATWAGSPHAARKVGCVGCHDGNATADDPAEAHRLVLPGDVRASPVHRASLPTTCGGCHPRSASAFKYSRHGAVLAGSDDRAPSCGSCHDSMSAVVPSPIGLQQACAACHLDDPKRGAYPSNARVLTEWLADARARLHEAQFAIARIAHDTTRRQLWERYDRAIDRANQAVGALHGFDLLAARSHLLLVRADLVGIEQRTRPPTMR